MLDRHLARIRCQRSLSRHSPTTVGSVTKLELLNLFVSKAGCTHSQQRAGQLWNQLLPLLTGRERSALMSAWGHHVDVRLGRGELDYVAKQIRDGVL